MKGLQQLPLSKVFALDTAALKRQGLHLAFSGS